VKTGKVQYACHKDVHILRFVGEIRYPMAPSLGKFVESLIAREAPRQLAIDLTETTLIDSTNLGQLARVANRMKASGGQRVTLISNRKDINIVLTSMGFDDIFKIIDDPDGYRDNAPDTIETPESSQDELAQVILAAHRSLMQISENNHDQFKDMVDLLEMETQGHSPGPSRHH
jgi:anti-anti-sigma factor